MRVILQSQDETDVQGASVVSGSVPTSRMLVLRTCAGIDSTGRSEGIGRLRSGMSPEHPVIASARTAQMAYVGVTPKRVGRINNFNNQEAAKVHVYVFCS